MSSVPQDRYNVLVEFAVKHLDFQRAELESVLDMFGIVLGSNDCRIVPLPTAAPSSSGQATPNNRPFYILSFPWGAKGPRYHLEDDPEGNIATVLSRCTLVRSVVELWGVGDSIESCADHTRQWVSECPTGKQVLDKRSSLSQSWKTTIHTLGAKYTREEQDGMRSRFAFLDFAGPVKMSSPTNEYILIREVELDKKGGAVYPRHGLNKQLIPENDARPPLAVYFGRILGQQGRSIKGRGGIDQYGLKNRRYLGPTSMDAELSFVMTNLGQVERGSVVFDPFVGTGSILLSCALRGAYCVGSDIDLRVLRGRSEDENVCANFAQYGLPRPELVRTDNAIYHRHYRRHEPLYDAIVCDPPYGIRAGARRTGSRLATPKPVLEEHRHDHIAQTKPYAVSDVMADLLDMASRTLVPGGRLVYVIPSFSDFNVETDLPQHECLRLVHVCYQPFTMDLGRRIVAMKKVAEYDESRRDKYMARVWKNGPESADKCANIREKILEAAKKKPGYEEKAAIRKEKRKKHREAKKLAKLKLGPPL